MCARSWPGLANKLTNNVHDSLNAPGSDNLAETTEFPQLYVYDVCLDKFGGRHEWMGFIDADEFLVLTGSEPSLPALLRGCAPVTALSRALRMHGLELGTPCSLAADCKCRAAQVKAEQKVYVLAPMSEGMCSFLDATLTAHANTPSQM